MNLRTKIAAAVAGPMAVIGLFLLTQPAQALTLVPPSLEFNVDPGQTVERDIKLFNEESVPISVFTSVSNFNTLNELGDPNFDFATELSDLASWIDVGTGPFTVQPGDKIPIPVTINVPADAEPGGHYASVFFGTDPSLKSEEGGQVNIRSLIGTLIILRVSGDVRESATIASFQAVDGKTLTNRLPTTFELRIANDGNVHVRPEGKITVKNLFGGETASLTINEAKGAVLPSSTRRFDVTWTKDGDTTAPGNFFEEIGYEWRNFALGPYTATASVTYGQSRLTLQGTTRITIIPWRIMTLIILLIVVVILILTVGLKRYNRSVIKHAQQSPPPKA